MLSWFCARWAQKSVRDSTRVRVEQLIRALRLQARALKVCTKSALRAGEDSVWACKIRLITHTREQEGTMTYAGFGGCT